ncbi:hypothetical protein [Fodinicola feengrottensis]|uniref:Uncharacterized protein n=1 Tax=Fodinicola feengrottensis TaxID=435914 RepID=A0ABP4UAH6_9ACTN|nr:hypothetical protein [Fodinicola feengrottensis]
MKLQGHELAAPPVAGTGFISGDQARKLIRALEIVRDSSATKARNWAKADESKAQEYRTQAQAYATALGGITLAQRDELK